MFNLGYREVIINSGAVITAGTNEAGAATVKIEGFGEFEAAVTAPNNFKTAGAAAAAGVYTLADSAPATTYVAGTAYIVKIQIKGPRLLSEIYPRNWDTLVFQTLPLATADFAGFSAALAGGSVSQDLAMIGDIIKVTDAGGVPTITFQPGYEGVELVKAFLIDGSAEALLPATATTAPTEGIGTGKQLEAEVRNATFDNIDPYGIQFGGNTAVDVRALYTTYSFSQMPDLNDWGAHEMLGYGDANTETMYGAVKFIVYANEASVDAAGMTLLDSLVTT